jgi:hypothetical protein
MNRTASALACLPSALTLFAALTNPAKADSDDHDTAPARNPASLDARSLHMFRETMDGGIEATLIRQGSHAELTEVRAKLRAEYERARKGAYPDGHVRGFARVIRVRFSELPTGAQISFTSQDPKAIAALHGWFAAQVRTDRAKHPGGGPGVGA